MASSRLVLRAGIVRCAYHIICEVLMHVLLQRRADTREARGRCVSPPCCWASSAFTVFPSLLRSQLVHPQSPSYRKEHPGIGFCSVPT